MFLETENRPGMTDKAGLFILIALMGAGAMIGSFASVLFWKLMTGEGMAEMQQHINNPAYSTPVRLMQTLLSVCMFLLPAIGAAAIVNRKPVTYLGFKGQSRPVTFMWTILLMGLVMVLGGSLTTLNQLIPVSGTMKVYFKELEDAYMQQIEVMSQINSPLEFIVSLLIMALLPAVVEEVFFRGGFQNMMQRATGKVWVSVIVTALLFSAIHFSFYGFLGRAVMGVFLGLMFAKSGNLWVPIMAHFFNNAVAVCQVYYLRLKGESVAEGMDENFPISWGIFAMALIWFAYGKFEKSIGHGTE